MPARCDIALLFLASIVICAVFAGAPAARSLRHRHSPMRSLVAFAAATLPPARSEWGRAMLAEFDQLPSEAGRTAFARGCVWAMLVTHIRHPLGRREPGVGLRALVGVAIAASCLLAGYGLSHYPGLRHEPGTWPAAALLALTLAGYGAVTISLSRQTGRDATAARSSGVATGLAIGGSWLVLLIGLAPSPNWSFLPLAIAVLAPSAVAAVVAFRARSVAAGSLAALWAGLVGGLTIFVVYSFTTLLHQGRPYDAVLIDEFHRSGAANLVTYAVGDGLMQALAMLLIVPVIALALGSICARAAGRQAA